MGSQVVVSQCGLKLQAQGVPTVKVRFTSDIRHQTSDILRRSGSVGLKREKYEPKRCRDINPTEQSSGREDTILQLQADEQPGLARWEARFRIQGPGEEEDCADRGDIP